MKVATFLFAVASLAAAALAADVPLESRSYMTVTGATMVEITDPDPSKGRTLPFTATVTFDLTSEPPSLNATIYNAVLERSDPFILTVQSDTFYKLADGSFRFDGDFIPNSQYFFSWTFSTNGNGQLVWKGEAGWAGGHIWGLRINDTVIEPVAKLEIQRSGSQLTLSWAAADAGYVLEQSPSLNSPSWTQVTANPSTIGNRISVTIDSGPTTAYFRLSHP